VGVSMVRLKVQGNEVDAGADAIGAQRLDEPARIRRRESLGTALCLADGAARIIARTAAVAVDAALLPKPSTPRPTQHRTCGPQSLPWRYRSATNH
jgi:hypothetical protein